MLTTKIVPISAIKKITRRTSRMVNAPETRLPVSDVIIAFDTIRTERENVVGVGISRPRITVLIRTIPRIERKFSTFQIRSPPTISHTRWRRDQSLKSLLCRRIGTNMHPITQKRCADRFIDEDTRDPFGTLTDDLIGISEKHGDQHSDDKKHHENPKTRECFVRTDRSSMKKLMSSLIF